MDSMCASDASTGDLVESGVVHHMHNMARLVGIRPAIAALWDLSPWHNDWHLSPISTRDRLRGATNCRTHSREPLQWCQLSATTEYGFFAIADGKSLTEPVELLKSGI